MDGVVVENPRFSDLGDMNVKAIIRIYHFNDSYYRLNLMKHLSDYFKEL